MEKTVKLNKSDLNKTKTLLLKAVSGSGYTSEKQSQIISKLKNNEELESLSVLTGEDSKLVALYNSQLNEWIENNETLLKQKEDLKSYSSEIFENTYANNVSDIENALSNIDNSKQDIENTISEIEALDGTASEEQYQNLIALNNKELEYYKQKKELAEEALKSGDLSDEQIAEYTQDIQDAEDAMSDLNQETNEWYETILELPIEKLEKVNEELNDTLDTLNELKDKYDSVISAVTSTIDDEIESIEKEQSEEEDYYDTLIENLQDELDALQDTNDERERAIKLQQAQYELEKAQNQKTNRVYKEGQGWVKYIMPSNTVMYYQASSYIG